MHKTDEELMTGYKMGETSCLEEIFGRYKGRIFNYALKLLANRADSEEALSQSFYTLTIKKDSYTPQSNAKFSTWFYRVAHNVCMDILRRRRRFVFPWTTPAKDETPGQQWEAVDGQATPDQHASAHERAVAVKLAIDKLPIEMREILVLREYQGLTYDQIALVVDCTLEKVKVTLFRARERLRVDLLPFVKEADDE